MASNTSDPTPPKPRKSWLGRILGSKEDLAPEPPKPAPEAAPSAQPVPNLADQGKNPVAVPVAQPVGDNASEVPMAQPITDPEIPTTATANP
ncbi:MAG: hypothetical protein JO112_17935, partial [Planctomycetes bacterium]|nr:hypothetical protein [Planctomycetota bacterium]